MSDDNLRQPGIGDVVPSYTTTNISDAESVYGKVEEHTGSVPAETVVLVLGRQISSLRQRVEQLETERDKLRKYADHILHQYSFDCDVDGGDAQDKALELGLIELRPINMEDSIDGETEHYFTVWTPRAALEPLKGVD